MPPRRTSEAGNVRSPKAAVCRAARAYAYLTRVELAELLGVHATTIDRWEAGRREPNDDEIAALCDACGLPAWRSLLERGDSVALRLEQIAALAEELRAVATGGEHRVSDIGDEQLGGGQRAA
jgi:transcriptional regulator with XRE-family HTH domain